MLFQIAHRLPAIEKNRWRARWEIYLLHARARALGKVQQFGHPGALSDANARIIQRTSACTGGRVLGMEMWRDIWSRFIMGKGGGEWVIREGRCHLSHYNVTSMRCYHFQYLHCRYWICVMLPLPWQYRMHLLWSESVPNSVALLFADQLFSNLTWGAVMQVAGEISGISVSLVTHNTRENIGSIGFSNAHIHAISGFPSRPLDA